MENIKSINYPNTLRGDYQSYITVGEEGCIKIEKIYKNGEMAAIGWIRVEYENGNVAEIKESICDLHGEL